LSFKGIGQSQGVHHRCQHPNLIGTCAIHTMVKTVNATPEVPPTDNDANLNLLRVDCGNPGRDFIRKLRVDTDTPGIGERFSTDLDDDTFVLGMDHAEPPVEKTWGLFPQALS
jgi:hypothetical protein